MLIVLVIVSIYKAIIVQLVIAAYQHALRLKY